MPAQAPLDVCRINSLSRMAFVLILGIKPIGEGINEEGRFYMDFKRDEQTTKAFGLYDSDPFFSTFFQKISDLKKYAAEIKRQQGVSR